MHIRKGTGVHHIHGFVRSRRRSGCRSGRCRLRGCRSRRLLGRFVPVIKAHCHDHDQSNGTGHAQNQCNQRTVGLFVLRLRQGLSVFLIIFIPLGVSGGTTGRSVAVDVTGTGTISVGRSSRTEFLLLVRNGISVLIILLFIFLLRCFIVRGIIIVLIDFRSCGPFFLKDLRSTKRTIIGIVADPFSAFGTEHRHRSLLLGFVP